MTIRHEVASQAHLERGSRTCSAGPGAVLLGGAGWSRQQTWTTPHPPHRTDGLGRCDRGGRRIGCASQEAAGGRRGHRPRDGRCQFTPLRPPRRACWRPRSWPGGRPAGCAARVLQRAGDEPISGARFAHMGVGGIVILGGGARSSIGRDLAAVLKAAPHGVKPFIASDEEGGQVQRLRDVVYPLPRPASRAAGACRRPGRRPRTTALASASCTSRWCSARSPIWTSRAAYLSCMDRCFSRSPRWSVRTSSPG